MKPPTKQPHKERRDTDESLRSERSKTDHELSQARSTVEQDADAVVDRARQRAETLVHKARERADDDIDAQAASDAVKQGVKRERLEEDGLVAQERATAEEQLHDERRGRTRALASLLRYERDLTDGRIFIERSHADKSLATHDEFLGMVSHDLRSLLGGIALSAKHVALLASEQGDAGAASVRGEMVRIQRFTARMNRLTGDLVDVASLEAGRLAVSPGPHDVVPLVREAIEAFQLSFAEKGLQLIPRVTGGGSSRSSIKSAFCRCLRTCSVTR